MVQYCCICNKSVLQEPKISLHRFPKDDARRKTWFLALNINTETNLPEYLRICSNHFQPEFLFTDSRGYRKLYPNAIPLISKSLDYPESTKEVDNASDISPNTSAVDVDATLTASETDLERTLTASETDLTSSEIEKKAGGSTSRQTSPIDLGQISEDDIGKTSKPMTSTARSSTPVEKISRKHFVGDFEVSDCDSPRKVKKFFHIAKVTITKQRKKLSSYNKAIHRLKRKVQSLQGLLQDLREKYNITENVEQSLQASVPESTKLLFQRMLKGPSTAKYVPALRSFALTLNFYSPRGYEYVRETFNKSLPHPRTLSKWYKTVDGSPGFLKESLKALCLKVEEAKKTNRQIYCNLVVDEMAIRSQIEWTGSKFTGYVDIGVKIDSDELPEAKEVIMFMLVALNSSWKVPVAYFLINSISGTERASLVLKCLEFVHESGIIVTSMTFDGAASNFAMAKSLGDFSDVNNLKTFFAHPVTSKPIFMFPDPCHMVKLVRNCIASQFQLQDEKGDNIKWEYFQNLVDIQEDEGVHAATKLKRRHLKWAREKMRVKLATQTLSKSVADAMTFLETSGNKNFVGAKPTSKFSLIFNNLFDIFNSRSRLCKYEFQRPLSPINFHQTIEYLKIVRSYILNLKLNYVPILNSQRKVGFLGFVLCIESIQKLYLEYVDGVNLKYLLTYKISQDHLELFFGAIRSRGGFNNNPTARQFEAAVKRLIIHTEVKAGNSGNAVNLDNISILYCSSRSPTTTAEGEDLLEGEDHQDLTTKILSEIEKYKYGTTSTWNLSDYVEDVVGYISGFVVKLLKKTVTCEKCLDIIQGQSSVSGLQTLKQYRKLTNASDFTVNICKLAEKYFRFFHKTSNIFNKNIKNLINTLTLGTLHTIPNNVLDSFGEHTFDDDPINGHMILIIKLLLKKYFTIRIHHETSKKLNVDRIRSTFTKTILFKNQ